MSRLHGLNVLRLRFMYRLCYPEFSLDNKASYPNAAAIMLLMVVVEADKKYLC